MYWFGPRWESALTEGCSECPVPADKTCWHCSEGFAADDRGIITDGYAVPMHLECFLRTVVGSAAHQLGKCACYGGAWEDPPPELTLRQAARLACDLFEQKQAEKL